MLEDKNINDLLDELHSTRVEIKGFQELENKLKKHQRALEATLMTKLDQQGVDRVGNEVCTVSLKKEMCKMYIRHKKLRWPMLKTIQIPAITKCR